MQRHVNLAARRRALSTGAGGRLLIDVDSVIDLPSKFSTPWCEAHSSAV